MMGNGKEVKVTNPKRKASEWPILVFPKPPIWVVAVWIAFNVAFNLSHLQADFVTFACRPVRIRRWINSFILASPCNHGSHLCQAVGVSGGRGLIQAAFVCWWAQTVYNTVSNIPIFQSHNTQQQ